MKEIKEERKKRGLTLRELANQSGVGYNTIQKIETGQNIGLCYLLKVLDFLNLKIQITKK